METRAAGAEDGAVVEYEVGELPVVKIHQRGVQWKQGVVVYMILLYTS